MKSGISTKSRNGMGSANASLRSEFEKLGVKAEYRSEDVDALFERAIACHPGALRKIIRGEMSLADVSGSVDGDINALVTVSQLLSEIGEFSAALQVAAFALLVCPVKPIDMKLLLRVIGDLLQGSRACMDRGAGARLRQHVHALTCLGLVDDVPLAQGLLGAIDERFPNLPACCSESDMVAVIDQLAGCLSDSDDTDCGDGSEIAELLARAFVVSLNAQAGNAMDACLRHLDGVRSPQAAFCRQAQSEHVMLTAVDEARRVMDEEGWRLARSEQGAWTVEPPSGPIAADPRRVLDYAKACFRHPRVLMLAGVTEALRQFAWEQGLQAFAQCLPSDMSSDDMTDLLDFLDVRLDDSRFADRELPAEESARLRDFLCCAATSGAHDPACCDRMYRVWKKLVSQSSFSVAFAHEARIWTSQRIDCRKLLRRHSGSDDFLSRLLFNRMDGISFSTATLVAQLAPPNRTSLQSPLRIEVLKALLQDEWSANPGMNMKIAVRLLVRCLPADHSSTNGFATILEPVLSQCSQDVIEELLDLLSPDAQPPMLVLPANVQEAAWSAGMLPDSPDLFAIGPHRPDDWLSRFTGDEGCFTSKLALGPDRRCELVAVALVSLMAKLDEDRSDTGVMRLVRLAERVGDWYRGTGYGLLFKAAMLTEIAQSCETDVSRKKLAECVLDLLEEYKASPSQQGTGGFFAIENDAWAKDLKRRAREVTT